MLNHEVVCNHRDKVLKCNDVPKAAMIRLRRCFYNSKCKVTQDNHLASLMDIQKPKRSRSRKPEANGQAHSFVVRYQVKKCPIFFKKYEN